VYFRLEELDYDPRDPSAIGLVDFQWEQGRAQGWLSLTGGLAAYFKARDLDFCRPPDSGSTFLRDVSALMSVLDDLFKSPAPETAVQVISRLLQFEGWHPRRGRKDAWHAAAVEACEREPGRMERANSYHQLLRRDWEFRPEEVDAFITVFAPQEAWGVAHRERLGRLGGYPGG